MTMRKHRMPITKSEAEACQLARIYVQDGANDPEARRLMQKLLWAVLRLRRDGADEIERLRNALNEVVTNGEWTEGEQRGDWKISPEVYETARDALNQQRQEGSQ